MYFLALATDYDGTLAHHGLVDAATVEAMEAFKASGRRLILVTGRDLPDLLRVFPQVRIFDRIVAENGALIYEPATEQERCIAPPPPPEFVQALRDRNVSPLAVGRSIVATWEPNEATVLEVIRELGLELQIIFNKGAVMVLPAGVNKAFGLAAALQELDLSAPNVVGVGDAENDHAFLQACGCAAAVANALPALSDEADVRLTRDHGAGVAELMEMIVREDGDIVAPRRHGLLVGTDRAGREVYLQPHRGSVLIAGTSGVGKSTLATALTERMIEKSLEFCVFDPEGDYHQLENAVCVGDAKTAASEDEALALLRTHSANVVISTQALSPAERPEVFAKLLPQLSALRASTGRPHWVLVDEAHHVLGAARDNIAQVLPEKMLATIMITVHPEALAIEALNAARYVLTMGEGAAQTLLNFCRSAGIAAPDAPPPEEDEVLFFELDSDGPARAVKAIKPKQLRDRHARKYAEGELGEDISFYFRGPANKLNLRAQNLMLFAQIAEGVDAETWEHHRRAREYSAWFRDVIKDDELAREGAEIEADVRLDADESRKRILAAISRRYTAPARGHRG
ncbi:MAG TPA: HAD-IIB family hydrolase [Aromatoleum sp.]|uniref:HAD-IIB family hydrolase n=1 Tax=Aromatoleum sp. TaxID=2307007 RepID=UPI002B467CF9|nr:HAD-IIB family hydrolase [Aromatoleum sp.]HJV26933.1 HAD-IIB family hydrolase [Aromatoleum sp.]